MFRQTTTPAVCMTADNINTPHGFTTRWGGVSSGVYESLDLGEHRGDSEEKVRENYRLLGEALGTGGRFAFSRQVHGTRVRYVTARDLREPFGGTDEESDGLYTDEPGVPLIIFTADCIPVLYHDPVRRAVAAVHAGWRGTVAGRCAQAVEKLVSIGCRPEDIRCAIGPGIGFCCFETGPEVPEAARALLGDAAEQFIGKNSRGRDMVDLKGINRQVLIDAGVAPENIEVSEECTMCLHDKYWSHRHTGGVRGSQASVIMLKGTE